MSSVSDVLTKTDLLTVIIQQLDAASLFAIERVSKLFRAHAVAAAEIWLQIASNMCVTAFVTHTYSYRAVVIDSFRFYVREAVLIFSNKMPSLASEGNPAVSYQKAKSALQSFSQDERIKNYEKHKHASHREYTSLMLFQMSQVARDLGLILHFPMKTLLYHSHADADAFIHASCAAEMALPALEMKNLFLLSLRGAFVLAYHSNQFQLPLRICEWIKSLSDEEYHGILKDLTLTSLVRVTSYGNEESSTVVLFKSQGECLRGLKIVTEYLQHIRHCDATASPDSYHLSLSCHENLIYEYKNFDSWILFEFDRNFEIGELWLLYAHTHSTKDAPDNLYVSDLIQFHNDQDVEHCSRLKRYRGLAPDSLLVFLFCQNYPFKLLEHTLLSTFSSQAPQLIECHTSLIQKFVNGEGDLLDQPSAGIVLYYLKLHLRPSWVVFKTQFPRQQFMIGEHFEELVRKLSDLDFNILTTWLPFFCFDFIYSPTEGAVNEYAVFDVTHEVLEGRKFAEDVVQDVGDLLIAYLQSIRSAENEA